MQLCRCEERSAHSKVSLIHSPSKLTWRHDPGRSWAAPSAGSWLAGYGLHTALEDWLWGPMPGQEFRPENSHIPLIVICSLCLGMASSLLWLSSVPFMQLMWVSMGVSLVATTNRTGLGEGKACGHSSHFGVPSATFNSHTHSRRQALLIGPPEWDFWSSVGLSNLPQITELVSSHQVDSNADCLIPKARAFPTTWPDAPGWIIQNLAIKPPLESAPI